MGNFENIIKSSTPTLVDFYAEWCGPCKMMSPLLEQVSSEIGETAKILKVDIDKNQSFAASYDIRSVPTLMIFKEGKVVWRQSGVPPKHLIVESIKKFV
jgi:thioredoxin 1